VGSAALDTARALASAAEDGAALVQVAVTESNVLLKMCRFSAAADVALRGFDTANQTGRQDSYTARLAAVNAAEAILGLGRRADAAAIIDPLTTGSPDRDHYVQYDYRIELEMLRATSNTPVKCGTSSSRSRTSLAISKMCVRQCSGRGVGSVGRPSG
jgi:hypothetical protein